MKFKIIIMAFILLPTSTVLASGLGTANTNTTNSQVSGMTSGLGTHDSIHYEDKGNIKPKYEVSIPNNNFLSSNSVNDSIRFSPVNLNNGFSVIDHIGHKDSAFTGARHIATYNGGIQWFGYDADDFSDMILTDKGIDGHNIDISLQQAPVRADWHTIDGSGIVFNAKTNAPADLDDLKDKSYTFEGYALVATTGKIELRYYKPTSFSQFSTGKSKYQVLFETAKTCNSQDFRIKYDGKEAEIFLDGKLLTKQSIKYLGNHVGAMVDYMEHNCESLSSVYMYNLLVNGKNYFEGDVKK